MSAVTIDQLRSYFATGKHPSRSDWNDFFDTLAALKDQIDAGVVVDVSKFIRKDIDDGTPFVLTAKNYRGFGGSVHLPSTMSLRSNAVLTSGQFLWYFRSSVLAGPPRPTFIPPGIPWNNPTQQINTQTAGGSFVYVNAKIGNHITPTNPEYPLIGSGILIPTTPETRIITADGVGGFVFEPLSTVSWPGRIIGDPTTVFAFYSNSGLTFTLTALNPPPPGGDQPQLVPLEDPSSVYAIGRTATYFGQNRDVVPLTVNLDAAHGGTPGTFMTNGPGQIIVPSMKWLTVNYVVLNAGTGNAADNLVALTAGLQS